MINTLSKILEDVLKTYKTCKKFESSSRRSQTWREMRKNGAKAGSVRLSRDTRYVQRRGKKKKPRQIKCRARQQLGPVPLGLLFKPYPYIASPTTLQLGASKFWMSPRFAPDPDTLICMVIGGCHSCVATGEYELLQGRVCWLHLVLLRTRDGK